MDIFSAIAQCFFGSMPTDPGLAPQTANDDARTANDIVDMIYKSEKSGVELKMKLQTTIRTYNWTENLGKAILNALDTAFREGRTMSPALKEAHDKACDVASAIGGFKKDHPIFCTVVVLGILVLLMPWVIEAIGFAAEGPVADSFAAMWQSRYMGYVPKGSLFSFFQRLGMKWHY